MADIDQIIDEIQYLNTLDGQAYIDEAARQGLVVTERGVFADPDHPAREFLTTEQNKAMITALFARHGVEVDLGAEPETHDV